MPLTLKVTRNPPFSKAHHKFRSARQKLTDNRREMIRGLGRKWVEIARTEAPEGRTGRFRRGIIFRTFQRSNDIDELRTYHPEPIGTWITKGTPPHIIRARRAKALRFLWEGGPRSSATFTAFHFYKFVRHPGTKANPYHERTTKRWRPDAIVQLRKLGGRFVIDLTG